MRRISLKGRTITRPPKPTEWRWMAHCGNIKIGPFDNYEACVAWCDTRGQGGKTTPVPYLDTAEASHVKRFVLSQDCTCSFDTYSQAIDFMQKNKLRGGIQDRQTGEVTSYRYIPPIEPLVLNQGMPTMPVDINACTPGVQYRVLLTRVFDYEGQRFSLHPGSIFTRLINGGAEVRNA